MNIHMLKQLDLHRANAKTLSVCRLALSTPPRQPHKDPRITLVRFAAPFRIVQGSGAACAQAAEAGLVVVVVLFVVPSVTMERPRV
jgi:hypothetical protein